MSSTPRADTIRVVVIGAGYAGMIATNRFLGSLTESERSRTAVTVVNPKPVFVERIRLHEIAAGSRDTATIPLSWLLHTDAETLVGQAQIIDAAAREVLVTTEDEEVTVPYDYLVYAVGSTASAPVAGAAEHGYLVGDHDGASAAAIRCLAPGARLAVVGGGLTGVETASEIAEQHPDLAVTLYCAGPLVAQMRPSARRSIRRSLERLGVRIEEHRPVTRVGPAELHLSNGEVSDFDVCIVAAAFDVPDLARVSRLPVDELGRLRVDEYLHCIGDAAIIGAGDAIEAPASVAAHLRMGCATALPLGAHAADSLIAAIRGVEPGEISIGYVLQCISLGRKRGYVQLVRADDSPRRLHVGGRTGARLKEWICEMVIDSPKKESTNPGIYTWPKGPKGSPALDARTLAEAPTEAVERFAAEHAQYGALSDCSGVS